MIYDVITNFYIVCLKINLFLHDLQGAEPVVSVARLYKEPSSAHVIGYVSRISKEDLKRRDYLQNKIAAGTRVGKTGLEKALENQLIGTNSIQRYEVNAYGKRINQIDYENGQQGKTIKLTIDS